MPSHQEPRYVYTYSADGRHIKKYNLPKGERVSLRSFARALAVRDEALRSGNVQYLTFGKRSANGQKSGGRTLPRAGSGGRRLISGRKREREEAVTRAEELFADSDDDGRRPTASRGGRHGARQAKQDTDKSPTDAAGVADNGEREEDKVEDTPEMAQLRQRIDDLNAKKLQMLLDLKHTLRVDEAQKQRQRMIQLYQQQQQQQQQQMMGPYSPMGGAISPRQGPPTAAITPQQHLGHSYVGVSGQSRAVGAIPAAPPPGAAINSAVDLEEGELESPRPGAARQQPQHQYHASPFHHYAPQPPQQQQQQQQLLSRTQQHAPPPLHLVNTTSSSPLNQPPPPPPLPHHLISPRAAASSAPTQTPAGATTAPGVFGETTSPRVAGTTPGKPSRFSSFSSSVVSAPATTTTPLATSATTPGRQTSGSYFSTTSTPPPSSPSFGAPGTSHFGSSIGANGKPGSRWALAPPSYMAHHSHHPSQQQPPQQQGVYPPQHRAGPSSQNSSLGRLPNRSGHR